MSLFASTSPSYLILQSLDRANPYLADGFREQLGDLIARLEKLKQNLRAGGWALVGDEPMKLTLDAKSYGYRGDVLADILRKEGFEPEFADPDYLVLMPSPQNAHALDPLEEALLRIPQKPAITEKMPAMGRPVAAMSLPEALVQPGRDLPLDQCLGKILAAPTVSCPPAVPILVCGERVDEKAVAVARYYGLETLNVL